MAVIYLEHPRHGQKVAMSDSEAAFDMANGWKKFDPIARRDEAEKAKQEAAAPVVERKKPGPKPKVEDVPNFLAQPSQNDEKPPEE